MMKQRTASEWRPFGSVMRSVAWASLIRLSLRGVNSCRSFRAQARVSPSAYPAPHWGDVNRMGCLRYRVITDLSQIVTVVLVLLAGTPAFTGDSALGRSCDLTIVGATDKQAFLRFDKELHTALSQQDVAATALLVRFPLRINYPDGSTILISNVKALQTRFTEAFPPTVRSAVIKQKADEVFCRDEGIMYGRGELWGPGCGYKRYRTLSRDSDQPAACWWSVGALQTDRTAIRLRRGNLSCCN